jgi:hypothetical protein
MDFRRAKIVKCHPLPDYRVRIGFDDGLEGDVNLSHLLGKGVFSAWSSLEFFNSVYIDPKTDTLAWPNGIDLDPYVLRSALERSA